MRRQFTNGLIVLAVIGLPLLAQRIVNLLGWTDYSQAILFKIGLNITLAVGLSLIIGAAGQFSIGHAGFMSVGAFAAAMFATRFFVSWMAGVDPAFLDSDKLSAEWLRAGLLLIAIVIGMGSAAVSSIFVGLPCLRLRGDYLAIATLGFGEIVYNLLLIFLQTHYQDTAYYMPSSLGFMIRPVNVASAWMLALVAILVVRNVVSSTSGRALPAIREDEIAAAAVGIRTTRYKLLAFAIGSVLAGAAGVLESFQTQTTNPASYRFDRSIEMVVPVVLGGSGSLTGCVIASGLFTYLLERLRDLPTGAQQYRTIVYAGTLVLIMILRPQGLMGNFELSDLWTRLRKKSRTSPAPCRPGDLAQLRPSIVSTGPILECRNLTIQFGGLTAVNRVNLALGPREILGLIGPNGAGKTTCFNMITGVYRPTAGDVLLADRSLVGRGTSSINVLGIARTFQNIRLFSQLTVLDNVRIALHAHLRTGLPSALLRTRAFYGDERKAGALAMHYLDVLQLSHLANERADSLPYGDQRRLEIARALATQPRVLCLDEPAAGMNPVEKVKLMELIRHLRDKFNLAVLLIEHDMRVVMGVCERIIVLDHGEKIAEGPPDQIRDNPQVIEAYLGEPIKGAA